MLQQTIGQRASLPIQIHGPGTPIELDRIPDLSFSADPDAPLVEALKARTAAAFDDLVKRYGHRLLNVAIRITKNREDAEDVVQESFLKVFKNIDGFRADSKFSTWLTQITINQALMLIRGNPQKFVSIDEDRNFEDRVASLATAASSSTPEQLCAQHEFEDVLLNLTNVRKSSRQVMELHVNDGLSEIEISQILSLTLSAVKARLYRGRLDLRAAMSRRFRSTQLAQACKKMSANPTSVSRLPSDNPLTARYSQSSCDGGSCLPDRFDPQLLTQPSHSSVGRPENCL